MIPTTIAQNIKKQVLHYLEATFSFRDNEVEKALSRFLQDPESGLFKGPWVQLKRPFRTASRISKPVFSFDVGFLPFTHQLKSWQRLKNSEDHTAEPTLITTGTGSGKTECFLFPILDYCLAQKKQGVKGIKAIILYPMNALASDQAKRFAKTIQQISVLKDANIRVGLYTGRYDPSDPYANKNSGTKAMGPDVSISNQAALQEDPPDILLTNYRMLDFLLMRPQDQKLWRFNKPGILKYLVLDELHTYDGAQGADVACLLRRLKERLEAPKGSLCVIGTSATIADKSTAAKQKDTAINDQNEDPKAKLARFASILFEEKLTFECVVDEDRLSVAEIIGETEYTFVPPANTCEPLDEEDNFDYAYRQSFIWREDDSLKKTNSELTDKEKDSWAIKLGEWLKKSELFEVVLKIIEEAEKKNEDPLTWVDLVKRTSIQYLGLKAHSKIEDRQTIMSAFFAMIAQAKEERNGSVFPLVPTQVQLWVRELRRLGRVVSEKPVFAWLDEPIPGKKVLPTYHCSECGASGWVAIKDVEKESRVQSNGVNGFILKDDPKVIYQGFFGYRKNAKDPNIVIISPWPENKLPEQNDLAVYDYFCPSSLVIRQGKGPCPITGEVQNFRVKINMNTRQNKDDIAVGSQSCPQCESEDGVFFIGSQSATLSSVAIDEMYGSILNSDPKLLAFTDSVQDASHRAGFFTNRTYQFTFRTALQHVIDESGNNGLPVTEIGKRLIAFWAEDKHGRPGTLKKAIAALLPTDLQDYTPYQEYRNAPHIIEPSPRLLREIEERLTWEAISEFSLMQTHGRTMERNGSACLQWDETIIQKTIELISEQLPKLPPSFQSLTKSELELWLYGLLQRFRERGVLYHPYLDDFARRNYWGKSPFGHTVEGREVFPPANRKYKPKFLIDIGKTKNSSQHIHLGKSSKGFNAPWQIKWSRRVLRLKDSSETDILDLIKMFLTKGEEAGLLKMVHEDSGTHYYSLNTQAAKLISIGQHLECCDSKYSMVRPLVEAKLWHDAPTTDYHEENGVFKDIPFNARQKYYQARYRKGALRKVVASEHTGLLKTEERENLERTFNAGNLPDDPNVLTCTSTLEMGIDIGDLSSTLLCSVPPTTASYLQRIGRAGRKTGTALIIAIINQRPHDMFFFARPYEILKGKIQAPGCWLDASAVLVRQYLGFCFDSGVKEGILTKLPKTGRQLVDDVKLPDGFLPKFFQWLETKEAFLQDAFLQRFVLDVKDDTRVRFLSETKTSLLVKLIEVAINEFDVQRKELIAASLRLKSQLEKLLPEDKDERSGLFTELNILRGRQKTFDEMNTLEILIDYGLLPNYAFPDRGVRFHGSIFNKHSKDAQIIKPIELIRPAGAALKELAPYNHFYTHSRKFEIQQLSIGSQQESLLEEWAICGLCGHMRLCSEQNKLDAKLACPQCGHQGVSDSQNDMGQKRMFLEFPKSQAISYMENYDSFSGDRDEERVKNVYQIIPSFDQTIDRASGAMVEEKLPFGIEYRAAFIMREVNDGFKEQEKDVVFGQDIKASKYGFQICRDCGVVQSPQGETIHRNNCKWRKTKEKNNANNQKNEQYKSIYLYRQLKSEAIRLLLPEMEDNDIETLIACIYQGLRLRFEGNPAHLIIKSQKMPDRASGNTKDFLVLMDAVPGGTGYLKTLYQEKDKFDRPGQGIMEVFQLAKDNLETCSCQRLKPGQEDGDGCYRCIRSYQTQYQSEKISRQRGIALLEKLINAGKERVEIKNLEDVKVSGLNINVLERKFIDKLKEFVVQRSGEWRETIIKGQKGYHFSLPNQKIVWALECQITLNSVQGVMIQSNPDFILSCDDESIKPIAIFTDGFEYHCSPINRLSDDMKKRRSIMESGNYLVWGITWHDLSGTKPIQVFNDQVDKFFGRTIKFAQNKYKSAPNLSNSNFDGFSLLKEFLECPNMKIWSYITQLIAGLILKVNSNKVLAVDFDSYVAQWQLQNLYSFEIAIDSDYEFNVKNSEYEDLLIAAQSVQMMEPDTSTIAYIVQARLPDLDNEVLKGEFESRWRKFLALTNFFQFNKNFQFYSIKEIENGFKPLLQAMPTMILPMTSEWLEVEKNSIKKLQPFIQELFDQGSLLPIVEHYLDDDLFAELAWPDLQTPVALLDDANEEYVDKWQTAGWKVFLIEHTSSEEIYNVLQRLKK